MDSQNEAIKRAIAKERKSHYSSLLIVLWIGGIFLSSYFFPPSGNGLLFFISIWAVLFISNYLAKKLSGYTKHDEKY